MEKQISFKHGVSEQGNLQTYQVERIVRVKDGEVIEILSETIHPPYTPKDVKNMEGFDPRSKEIVAAITTPEAKADFEAEKQEPTGVGLEEIVTHDRMIDDLGRISVRRVTRIFDDGKEISKKYHRSWLMPGDDPDKADAISKALAKRLHTKAVKDAWEAKKIKDSELLP